MIRVPVACFDSALSREQRNLMKFITARHQFISLADKVILGFTVLVHKFTSHPPHIIFIYDCKGKVKDIESIFSVTI